MIGTINISNQETIDPNTGEVRQVETLAGRISVFGIAFTFRMQPLERRSPDSPSFAVEAKGPHGGWADVGRAWTKVIERGDKAGAEFFTITFDDEAIRPHIAGCSAFPSDRTRGQWDIQRNRARQAGQGDAA